MMTDVESAEYSESPAGNGTLAGAEVATDGSTASTNSLYASRATCGWISHRDLMRCLGAAVSPRRAWR